VCFTYRCTIFLHWVSHFVILVFSSFAREEARLAHVEIEALQAAIPETLELERKQNVESAKINLHALQKWSNNFWGAKQGP
jgi:hypothetical protein